MGRAREAVPIIPEVAGITRADLRSWFRDGVFRTALTRGLVRGVFVRVYRTFVTTESGGWFIEKCLLLWTKNSHFVF